MIGSSCSKGGYHYPLDISIGLKRFCNTNTTQALFVNFLNGLFCTGDNKTQKLSAADVALYGLHVIIPLMSSDVLMVRKKSFISLLFNWIDFTVASRRSTGVPVKRFFSLYYYFYYYYCSTFLEKRELALTKSNSYII